MYYITIKGRGFVTANREKKKAQVYNSSFT